MNIEQIHTFKTPKDILTGADSLNKLQDIAPKLGHRALLVSGDGTLERLGVLDNIRSLLKNAELDFDTHSGILPEPCLDAVELLRGRLHEGFDLVISVGGGSVLDVAKAAAGLAHEDAPAREYQHGRNIITKGLNHIAIPTTAGTGSEVTPNAVITDPEGPCKISIRGEHLMPSAAIVDPKLLLTLPPRITAESGMDALSHAIESYVSLGASPLTEALSLKATKLLATGLLHAYEDGKNLEARTKCAWGSLLAGMALANARLGVVHGLAHPVGARLHIPHGKACAMLLPASIEFNKKSSYEKYSRLATSLAQGFSESRRTGLTAAITREDISKHKRISQGGPDVANILRELISQLGLPLCLDDSTELDDTTIKAMVTDGMPSGSMRANPRTVTPEDAEAILKNLCAK